MSEMIKNLRPYIAELLGTFVLVFIGVGSAVFAGSSIGLVGISIAFGTSVLIMVYTIGPISGCHINPAVTISMFVAQKINAKDTVFYIIFQCIGALLAAFTVFIIASDLSSYSLANGLAANGFDALSPEGYSMIAAFIAEFVFTFIFLLVIFGATADNANERFAGLAIGSALTIIHLAGIPITNLSVNPARSLGPALIVMGDTLMQVWLFWLAPILGGIFAAFVWTFILEKA